MRAKRLGMWIMGSVIALTTVDSAAQFPPKNDFRGLVLDPEAHGLLLYEEPIDYERLAHDHIAAGMPWIRRHPLRTDLFDDDLIPMVDYSFGRYRNPVATAIAALAFIDRMEEVGDEMSERGFRNNAYWLLDNLGEDHYWHYGFVWNHAGKRLPVGWTTAMAQGMGLGVFMRAHRRLGDDAFLEAAHDVFETFTRNSDEWWTFGVTDDGYYWLEEYPSEDFCHVLNGMLFGLFGLWDYYAVTEEPFALTLFQASLRAFVDHVDLWNAEGIDFSRYCAHRLSYQSYHEIHIEQFAAYYDTFGIEAFRTAGLLYQNLPVAQESPPTWSELALANHPNPFRHRTTLTLELPRASPVEVIIYDMQGRQVAVLADGYFAAGERTLTWAPDDLPAGVYFARLEAGSETSTHRMVLLR